MEWIKSLNWPLFLIIMACAYAGALGNENCDNVSESFILGTIGGLVFAIPFMILTKDSKN